MEFSACQQTCVTRLIVSNYCWSEW